MKRTSTFLAVSVLLHLLVVDLTYYWITSENSGSIVSIASYNLIWILIAINIVNHEYTKKQEKNKEISS